MSSSDSERVRFLEGVAGKWDPAQMIHEFSGPNRDNWVSIVGTAGGRAFGCCLRLLAHADLHTNDASTPLYAVLMEDAPMRALMTHVVDGALAEDALLDGIATASVRGWEQVSVAAAAMLLLAHGHSATFTVAARGCVALPSVVAGG